jgi:hypothetical protein
MPKYFFTALILLITTGLYSQGDNSTYFHKPFAIYKSPGQVIIAGALNNYVYLDYFGKDVQKEGCADPHSKPECLVYQLFKDMKNKDVAGLSQLYDSSFVQKDFDGNRMADKLKGYTDIKFLSKFRSGDFTVVRYNFISAQHQYPYFAALKRTANKYFLTADINLSDPFTVIGSFSPYNLFNKTEESVNTGNLTAFYFVNKENKILFTNDLPNEDYSALYLGFEFYNHNNLSTELDFIRQLQSAAHSGDSAKMKSMLSAEDLPLLKDPYYSNYYDFEILKIFGNYSQISLLAGLATNEGKVLYFKYSDSAQSSNIASILIKQSNGRNYLSLRCTNRAITSILQNVYIREAIYDYFKSK